jgi:glycerol-3-phosphate acyltransferase PlsY
MRIEFVNVCLAILTGYLLGSVLPGYFLPMWLKKIDIRTVGDGNPGVINVYRQTGLLPAVLTCLYDLSKSLLTVYIAQTIFKVPLMYAYLAGFTAVLALRFPFYLGFRGGRGVAATISLFTYIFIKILMEDLSRGESTSFLIYLVLYALLLLLSSHGRGDLFTATGFPIIGIYMLLHLSLSANLLLILALCALMTLEAVRNLVRDGIVFGGEKAFAWRNFARLLLLLFIPVGMTWSRTTLLLVSGGMPALFGLFDIIRFFNPKVEATAQKQILSIFRLCRLDEQNSPSSMTIFFMGLWLCFLFFDRNIAFACLGFVTLTFFLAELVETNFGEKKLYKKSEKTAEGRLAFLSGAVTLGFFFWSSGLLPLNVMGLGALVACLTEALPIQKTTQLAIPLVAGVVMSLL